MSGLRFNQLGFLAALVVAFPWLCCAQLSVDPLETVVLLGGGAGEAPNRQVQVNSSGDRVVLAARLYQREGILG